MQVKKESMSVQALPESSIVLTPAEFNEFIKRKIGEIATDSAMKGFMCIEGVIGDFKASNYPTYYGVPVRDASGSVAEVDIRKDLITPAIRGKQVKIYGFLRLKAWNGKLSFSLEATKINLVAELSKEVLEQEKLIGEFLRTHSRKIKSFPKLQSYNISIIHGVSSLTKDDFIGRLEGVEGISIQCVAANLLQVSSFREAFEEATGDIVVVVRGGGSGGEFEVFNSLDLLEAWINKDAYRISALGHTDRQLPRPNGRGL